jgi:hypothetical protein
MRVNRKNRRNELRLLSAIGSVALLAAPALAGTTIDPNTGLSEVTISISGSTALKNFITSQGFTDLLPDTSITPDLGGVPGDDTTLTAGGSAMELAPSNTGGLDTSTSYNALRVEYHESGSVEGILEMANDQIGDVNYVEDNIDRNPNGGNAVWVNGNQIGGLSPPGGNALTLGNNDPGGNYLGPFYGTTGGGAIITAGPGVNATFSMTGQNISSVSGSGYTQAGQNAVQLAISDVVPVQAFQNDYSAPSTAAASGGEATPWFSNPTNYGYGQGNTKLQSGGLGVAGGGVNLQSSSLLDMPASAINPRTGGTFGVGPWNSGGLANLNNETTAVSATLFVANPGTGLDRLDQTDAQWLETTGRLQNGAAFEMTTRDVNSGTRNVAALDVGVDPSWAVGVDDSGNGNTATGATTQIDIGSQSLTLGAAPVSIGLIRFSNKTAGGAQLRPTVQNDRMSVGTLSVGDANGVFTAGNSYGLRALDYSPSQSGSAPYVQVSAYAIINGTYQLYQNEQLVTLKAPQAGNAAFDSMTTSQWAQVTTNGTAALAPTSGFDGSVPIQGDDSTGAVSQVINNVQTSIANLGLGGFDSSSIAYISKGFILPDMMAVEKPENGMPSSPVADQNVASANQLLSSSFTVDTTGSDPDQITAVAGNTYGGKNAGGQAFNGSINQTSYNNINGANDGGNWLFGNFNQNGIRDFDSVVVQATEALAILENAEDQNNGGAWASANSFSGLSNNAVIGTMGPVTINGITYTMPTALSGMINANNGIGATKGDLIMMGDMDGRGVFDGQSLYEMAVGASLTTNLIGTAVLPGVNDRIVLQSETLTVMAANTNNGSSAMQTQTPVVVNSQSFGDAVRTAVLNKNTALNYLNVNATPQMKAEAAAILNVPGNSSNVPFGATDLGNIAGTEYFSYDPNGVNAFNPNDVNRDGVIDFNDAILVDNNNGNSYSNLGEQLLATQQTPVTGAIEPLNLVLAQQVDGEAAIGAADLKIENQGLATTGNANWYGYTIQKTGPGAIIWGRTAGTVTVYTGATFGISAGAVQVGGTVDPFTDNNLTGPTVGNHVALTVSNGGELQLNQTGRTITVSGLTVDLPTSGLVDIGSTNLAIDYTPGNDPITNIVSYLTSGYKNGTWTGTAGIVSSIAAAAQGTLPLLSVGYGDGNVDTGLGNSTLTAAAPNQVLVKFTLAGDALLNGTVDFNDLDVVGKHLNTSGNDWAQGNFNYDGNGATNFNDLDIVGQNLNKSLAEVESELPAITVLPLEANVAVTTNNTIVTPEPTSIALAAIGAAGLLARRRRRSAK